MNQRISIVIVTDSNPSDLTNGMGLIVAATLNCLNEVAKDIIPKLILTDASKDLQELCRNNWPYLARVDSISSNADGRAGGDWVIPDSIYEASIIVLFSTTWSSLTKTLVRRVKIPVLLHCNDSLAFYYASQFPKRIFRCIYAIINEAHSLRWRNLRTIVTCGHGDCSWIKTLAPRKHVISLPNGIDVSRFPFKFRRLPCDTVRLIFAGVLDYEPNVNAIRGIVQNVLPRLHVKYSFTVIGSRPCQEIYRIAAKDPNIRVIGYVPELYPYYHDSDLCVCPISIRTGIKNKIIEAIATGTPVITFDRTLKNFAVSMPGVIGVKNWRDVANAIDQFPRNWTELRAEVEKGAELIRRTWGWPERTKVLIGEVRRMAADPLQ